MKQTVVFYDDIYKTNVCVQYGGTEEEYIKFIKRLSGGNRKKSEHTDITGNCFSYLQPKTNQRYVFIWATRMDVLIHELFHATYAMLCHRLVLNWDTEEAYAYLIESLYLRITKKLNNNKTKG